MDTLSLFIHFPVNQSTKEALDSITESGLFSIHTLPLDLDLTPLILECRPCVCLLPLNAHGSNIEVYELLRDLRNLREKKGQPIRDPRLRIILIAEERGFQSESWVKLGVHEIVIAPVLPKALAYKLARHYYRATSHPPFTAESPPPVEESEWVPHQNIWRSHLGKNSTLTSGFASIGRTIVSAEVQKLNETEGEWVLDHNHEGFEENWRWKSYKPSSTEWSFHGDKPVYNKQKKFWIFQGENPVLWTKDELQEGGVAFESDEVSECVHVRMEDKVKIQKVKKQYFATKVVLPHAGSAQKNNPATNLDVEKMIQFLENWEPKESTRLVETSGGVKVLKKEALAASQKPNLKKLQENKNPEQENKTNQQQSSYQNQKINLKTKIEAGIKKLLENPSGKNVQDSEKLGSRSQPNHTPTHSHLGKEIKKMQQKASLFSKDQINQTLLKLLFPNETSKNQPNQNMGNEKGAIPQKFQSANIKLEEENIGFKPNNENAGSEQKNSDLNESVENIEKTLNKNTDSKNNGDESKNDQRQLSQDPVQFLKTAVARFSSQLPQLRGVFNAFSKIKTSLFGDKRDKNQEEKIPFHNKLDSRKNEGSTWSIQMEGRDYSFKSIKPKNEKQDLKLNESLRVKNEINKKNLHTSSVNKSNEELNSDQKKGSWFIKLLRKAKSFLDRL